MHSFTSPTHSAHGTRPSIHSSTPTHTFKLTCVYPFPCVHTCTLTDYMYLKADPANRPAHMCKCTLTQVTTGAWICVTRACPRPWLCSSQDHQPGTGHRPVGEDLLQSRAVQPAPGSSHGLGKFSRLACAAQHGPVWLSSRVLSPCSSRAPQRASFPVAPPERSDPQP